MNSTRDTDDASTDVITYRPAGRPSPKERRVILAVWLVAALVLVGINVHTGHWTTLLSQIPLLALTPVVQCLASRRTYRADADGIHTRPVLEKSWSQSASVKKPTQWDVTTMVRMHETGEERNTGFPTSYAEQLARLGDKPLE